MSRGDSCRLEPDVEADGHATQGGKGRLESASAAGRYRETAGAAAAALRRRIAFVRSHETLLLQAVERFVHGAEREVAAGEAHDLVMDGDAVGRVADAEDGQEDDLFEFA